MRRVRLVAALLLSPLPAAAHDAQRVKYVAAVQIAAPAEKVWAVIGNFQDLSWDRAVASVAGHGGNAPGVATRTVRLADGAVLPDEELERYKPDDFTYATFLPHVDVKLLPVTNYASVLVVIPLPDSTCRVEWRSAFYRGYPNFGPPPGLDEAAAFAAVKAMTEPALAGLKERMEKK